MLKLTTARTHQDLGVMLVELHFSDAPEIEGEARLPKEIAVQIIQSISDSASLDITIPEYLKILAGVSDES